MYIYIYIYIYIYTHTCIIVCTQDFSCPGQPTRSGGAATNKSSIGYRSEDDSELCLVHHPSPAPVPIPIPSLSYRF